MFNSIKREWLTRIGSKTLLIELGSPWENGFNKFNGKLRDELLNGEIFYTLKEAKVLIEEWRKNYYTIGLIVHLIKDHRHQKQYFLIFGRL